MGWSYGIGPAGRHAGEEIGYGVDAICDEPGCDTRIDRGLAYACGDQHGSSDTSCGGYFCATHLYSTDIGQRCEPCADENDARAICEAVGADLNAAPIQPPTQGWPAWADEHLGGQSAIGEPAPDTKDRFTTDGSLGLRTDLDSGTP